MSFATTRSHARTVRYWTVMPNINQLGYLQQIEENKPTPITWLIGYGYLKAHEEGLTFDVSDVPELLREAGVSRSDRQKADIIKAYSDADMLSPAPGTRPTVCSVKPKLGAFVRLHQAEVVTDDDTAQGIERAWQHVRTRLLNRGVVER